MMNLDETVDPALQSWLPVPDDSDFPIQNLPYAVARRDGEARVVVALGDHAVDLLALARDGAFDAELPNACEVFGAATLNPFAACGPAVERAVRWRLSRLLRAGQPAFPDKVWPLAELELGCPIAPGDFVDCLTSEHHAINVAAILSLPVRLPPQWNDCPIAYHGRAGTVVQSGAPIVRPSGPRRGASGEPSFGPSEELDYELEVGIVIGGAMTPRGRRVAVGAALDHVFGLVLLNDWSARDIQFFESQPLGPFLGKSFATSISPWLVSPAALAPFRTPALPRASLPYLREPSPISYAVELEAALTAAGTTTPIARTRLDDLRWTIAQQVAHVTASGASLRPGDLIGTGTISGPGDEGRACLLERTEAGRRPLRLADGQQRIWLEDGDRITLRARAAAPGYRSIGFGVLTNEILPGEVSP